VTVPEVTGAIVVSWKEVQVLLAYNSSVDEWGVQTPYLVFMVPRVSGQPTRAWCGTDAMLPWSIAAPLIATTMVAPDWCWPAGAREAQSLSSRATTITASLGFRVGVEQVALVRACCRGAAVAALNVPEKDERVLPIRPLSTEVVCDDARM
jgi:hypothetical protein